MREGRWKGKGKYEKERIRERDKIRKRENGRPRLCEIMMKKLKEKKKTRMWEREDQNKKKGKKEIIK